MAAPHIRISASAAIVDNGNILLVRFEDETGPHYNLPGGGADAGESLAECCIRETLEETSALITVGRLLLVREYEPRRCRDVYGRRHKINFVFEGALAPGATAAMPRNPDANQVGVDWVPLDRLTETNLVSPVLARQLLEGLAGAPTLYVTEYC